MKLSQYVLDVIESVNSMGKDSYVSSISRIREAASKALSDTESHILNTIAGAATMYYSEKECSFAPEFTFKDGSRSFALEDISESDIEILRSVITVTQSPYLRTKFSHIIWCLNRDNRYGEIAVKGYIDGFQGSFDPDSWVECYEQIRAAYHISSAMGKKSESFKKTRAVINQKLEQLSGSDSLFLSLSLLKLILKEAPKEDLPKYNSIVCSLVTKNLNYTNSKTNLADETFSVLEQLYRRLKKEEELQEYRIKYASYYEMKAKEQAQNGVYFRAIIMLKKACTLFSKINHEKLLELRILLEEWQKVALQEMHVHKYEIDIKPIYEIVEPMFKGLSQTEAIIQFGRIAKVYHVEDVKKKLLENQEQSIIASLFGSSLLNEQGQSVQELSSIKEAMESDDSDAIKKHMVRYVAEQRSLCDLIPIRISYQFLKEYGPITEDDLDFLVADNAIIPENRKEIIKQGLCWGLNGKLYVAMHILQPQTENLIRNLVKMCGDTVTFLKEDGSEEYKPLSSLFKSEKLRECYNEDILFTLQSIMDDPAGENLRNLNGHGLLEPEMGNSTISLYFLSLLILLLSLYGKKSLSIRRDLAERGHSENVNHEV